MHRRLVLVVFALLAMGSAANAQQFQEQTATRFPSPNPTDYTNYAELSDIDADGDLDIVFANGGNFSSAGAMQPVRVYVNDGAGVFEEESERVDDIVGNFRGVAFGDIDRDGDDDLILSSDFNRQPILMINDGTGDFTDDTAARVPVLTLSATRAAFGDIDNDGDLDIYINDGGPSNRFGCGQNLLLMNDGSGVFTDGTAGRHPIENVCQPMDVLFFDMDNDFDLDIRTGNRFVNSRLYENDGTGVYSDVTDQIPTDGTTYSFDAGDINGDGNLDLIGINSGGGNQEQLLLGDGTGNFTNVSGQLSPNTSGDDNDSKFFDLDNDGDMDLVIASLFQSREKIYINNGAGLFTLDSTIITSNSDATLDVMVADFDGDDRIDILTLQGESGNFQNRYYANVTGAADTLGPTVVHTEVPAGGCATEHVIRARVEDGVSSDRGFYDRGVTLNYQINGGSLQSVDMDWSGNSMWRGVIPGDVSGAVEYYVTAIDWASNAGTGPTQVFTSGGDADIDSDGDVDVDDLLAVLGEWGCSRMCDVDVTCDGQVDVNDVLAVLANFG